MQPNALERLFLTRLGHILQQEAAWDDFLPATSWRKKLINKALWSTLRDCDELSIGAAARQVMIRVRVRERRGT